MTNLKKHIYYAMLSNLADQIELCGKSRNKRNAIIAMFDQLDQLIHQIKSDNGEWV